MDALGDVRSDKGVEIEQINKPSNKLFRYAKESDKEFGLSEERCDIIDKTYMDSKFG